MKKMVSLKIDAELLARTKRAAAQSLVTWTTWVEEAMLARLEGENPMRCAACGQVLDPHHDPVVYLGFGRRADGGEGPGWVLALCGPTPEEVNAQVGSQCVEDARKRLGEQEVVPSTYEEWLGVEVWQGPWAQA